MLARLTTMAVVSALAFVALGVAILVMPTDDDVRPRTRMVLRQRRGGLRYFFALRGALPAADAWVGATAIVPSSWRTIDLALMASLSAD